MYAIDTYPSADHTNAVLLDLSVHINPPQTRANINRMFVGGHFDLLEVFH